MTKSLKRQQKNNQTLTTWKHLPKLLLLITLAAVFSLLYVNLSRDRLFNWDEGIYSELGRSILNGQGSLLTPSWNNDLWLEKPPLIAWVTAIGMSLFGVSELGARALMPVFAVLTLFFVYKIGNKLGGWMYGQLAMSLLATFNLFQARARAVNTDGILLFAITMTFYLVLSGAPVFWVALGISIGILTKGVAGLLVVIISFPLIIAKGFKYCLKLAAITLGLTLPWHVYQYLVNGSAFYTPYILEQVLRRATVPIEFHMESRWYYFQFLAENLQGGTLYLLIISLLFLAYHVAKTRKLSPELILVWWLALPLVIFTLAKTRLYWYILPIYPSIALLIAYLFTRFTGTKILQKMLLVFVVGLSMQAAITIGQSVEMKRTKTETPLDVDLAIKSSAYNNENLLVLVPESERVAEAILPLDQRIGSSFRYGGSPNLVFYSKSHVIYFYNVDEWIIALEKKPSLTLFAIGDLSRLPKGYVVESINASYVLAIGSEDAIR